MPERTSGQTPPRPFAGKGNAELQSLIEVLRAELRYRSTPSARRLREEIDPEFEIERSADCCVYVIELRDEIRKDKGFAEANPDARADLPCLYVGSTNKNPEERFEQHKQGVKKASKRVRNHGVRLRPEFFELFGLMTRSEAEAMERSLAELLRREGYAVWQH